MKGTIVRYLDYMVTALIFRLNPDEDEIESLKREIDTDGSGEIDFQEFLEIMNSKTLRY